MVSLECNKMFATLVARKEHNAANEMKVGRVLIKKQIFSSI